MRLKRCILSIFLVVTSVLLTITPFFDDSLSNAAMKQPTFEEKTHLVSIDVPNQNELDKLVAKGFDLTEHYHKHEDGSYEVDAILSSQELETLIKQGYNVEIIDTKEAVQQRLHERQVKVEQINQELASEDTITILRANYFTNYSGTFLYVEAKTSAYESKSVALTASWDSGKRTEIGSGGTASLQRLEDLGKYLYHQLLIPVEKIPYQLKIESNLGGKATALVTEWIGEEKPTKKKKHYVTDFIDHYMDPTEITQRIEALAQEFPEIAEIVELPYKTNGYRRKAQGVLGNGNSSYVTVTSKAWGHEGGNEIKVALVDPKKENAPLSVKVEGSNITVYLETDADGEIVTTASEVVKALNEKASNLIFASIYKNNTGNELVIPQEVQLSDFLNAPATISREPFTVKAIRIGKHRDGSKLGVLAYSQEHAREWVTPLVSIETAERLLRNYAHDRETKKLVDNLDIFIIPTVNPDGAHYSMYDYNWQRKNMTNYCEDTSYSTPFDRNYWGVDLNRNHSVGSVYDGYIGASTNCTSAVYAGPEELSEPEAKNIIWLAEKHPNIKFAMNIHSYGGYFMWPPGAYNENRETLPRPTAGEEAYFWQASELILDEIKKYRGTVILPSRTGPIPDVLYSAAGNSADALWYNYGIFAWDFEVGADIWDPESKKWKAVGFQPDFEEGHAEAMEFANGMIGLYEVAYQYAKDRKPPTSKIIPGKGKYNGPIEVRFEVNEPATIFYTLDGSRPTFNSPKLQIKDVREGAETLLIDKTTTINWFAMDVAGNVENRYNPDSKQQSYNSETIIIK
jgi:hypothetical protein